MGPDTSAPQADIDRMFQRLKGEIGDYLPALCTNREIRECINCLRQAHKKALNRRDPKELAVIERRIEQYSRFDEREGNVSDELREMAYRQYYIRKVVHEALVDTWNGSRGIYSKDDLVQRTETLLSSLTRRLEIRKEFNQMMPGDENFLSGSSSFELFMSEALAYLHEEKEID